MKRNQRNYPSRTPYTKRRKLAGEPVSERAAQVDTARELALLKKKVRKITSNIEVKNRSSTFTSPMVSESGDTVWLSATGYSDIPRGDADDQRIGDSIAVKRILVKGMVETTSTNLFPTSVRILLFRDKIHRNANGIAASNLYGTSDSILEQQSTGAPQVQAMLPRHNQATRYQIYRDIVLVANPQAVLINNATNTTQFARVQMPFSFDVSIPDIKVHYNDAEGGNNDVNDNMFQLSVATYQATLSSAPTVSISSQIFYTDL